MGRKFIRKHKMTANTYPEWQLLMGIIGGMDAVFACRKTAWKASDDR